jgi:hypothetical protein
VEAPEAVRAAWQAVTEHWDEPARHEALLGLVAQHACFAWAAARYKERAGDAIADEQIERLRRAATATMLATATPRPSADKQPYKNTLIIFIALVAMAILGLVLAKLIHDSRSAEVTNPR